MQANPWEPMLLTSSSADADTAGQDPYPKSPRASARPLGPALCPGVVQTCRPKPAPLAYPFHPAETPIKAGPGFPCSLLSPGRPLLSQWPWRARLSFLGEPSAPLHLSFNAVSSSRHYIVAFTIKTWAQITLLLLFLTPRGLPGKSKDGAGQPGESCTRSAPAGAPGPLRAGLCSRLAPASAVP